MKRIILLLGFLLVACGPRVEKPPETTITPYGVKRFIDHEAGVVCWLSDVYYGDSISCLPLSETLLEDAQP